MPASMISAPTGGRPKVIGKSIATVAMVPMPGNTPTSVPTSAPIRQSIRLTGLTATEKPRIRLWNRSAIAPSRHDEAGEQWHRQSQHIREQQCTADREADADDEGLDPARLGRAERGDQEARKPRHDKAQRADGEREKDDGEHNEERSAP